MSEDLLTTADATELVFIYGDLRMGCAEAFRMEGASYLSKGEVAGVLLEISGRPALVPRYGRENSWVTGDLFHVSPAHIEALDSLCETGSETGGDHYQRVRIKVHQPASTRFLGEAWTWQWTGSTAGGNIVRPGDWMEVAHPRPGPWCTLLAAGSLIGFFPAVGVMLMNANRPMLASSRLDQLLAPLILLVPLVGVVAAWWGLRRREYGKFLTMVVLVVSAIFATLSLIVLASILMKVFR